MVSSRDETITGFHVYCGKIPDGYLYRIIFNNHDDLVDTVQHQPKSASLQDAGAASAAFVLYCKNMVEGAAGRCVL